MYNIRYKKDKPAILAATDRGLLEVSRTWVAKPPARTLKAWGCTILRYPPASLWLIRLESQDLSTEAAINVVLAALPHLAYRLV